MKHFLHVSHIHWIIVARWEVLKDIDFKGIKKINSYYTFNMRFPFLREIKNKKIRE